MKGLHQYSLLQKLRLHSLVDEVFLKEEQALTTELLTDLMKFNFGPEGSNRRKNEESAATIFLNSVKDMEGEYVHYSFAKYVK